VTACGISESEIHARARVLERSINRCDNLEQLEKVCGVASSPLMQSVVRTHYHLRWLLLAVSTPEVRTSPVTCLWALGWKYDVSSRSEKCCARCFAGSGELSCSLSGLCKRSESVRAELAARYGRCSEPAASAARGTEIANVHVTRAAACCRAGPPAG
jgi:hypothetical protein